MAIEQKKRLVSFVIPKEEATFAPQSKNVTNNKISIYLISLQRNYSSSEKMELGLADEFQNGNDYGLPTNGKNTAFSPIYGTNHKFNGFMDYFYVGNHIDNVGLFDILRNAACYFNSKLRIILNFHKFFAASKIDYAFSKDLGFEIDLVTSYSLNKFVGIKAGYSHFFASKGIETVKNNYQSNRNDWAWIMISIDSVLFNWKENKTSNN